jgi:hypothetical protein
MGLIGLMGDRGFDLIIYVFDAWRQRHSLADVEQIFFHFFAKFQVNMQL